MNLRIVETESEKAVVVLNDISKRCESAVVEETTRGVRPESSKRSCAVTIVRGATGLEVVDSDLLRRMHVPSRLGE